MRMYNIALGILAAVAVLLIYQTPSLGQGMFLGIGMTLLAVFLVNRRTEQRDIERMADIAKPQWLPAEQREETYEEAAVRALQVRKQFTLAQDNVERYRNNQTLYKE